MAVLVSVSLTVTSRAVKHAGEGVEREGSGRGGHRQTTSKAKDWGKRVARERCNDCIHLLIERYWHICRLRFWESCGWAVIWGSGAVEGAVAGLFSVRWGIVTGGLSCCNGTVGRTASWTYQHHQHPLFVRERESVCMSVSVFVRVRCFTSCG